MTEPAASPQPSGPQPETNTPPKQPSGTQPIPNLIDLINILAEKADPLVKLLTTTIKGYQDGKDREVRFQTRMAWVAVSVVVLIVGVASFLTYHGKIDGSTFTFLLGLIVGYVLTFVRDQITGLE
jgi:lipopolysaccharide export LptBFGC system permease protein LptF